jgi:aminopeptidase N
LDEGGVAVASEALASILAATAADETLEPAFRAQALALPSEADIAREIGNDIDTDTIHAARDAVIASIATGITGQLQSLYDTMRADNAFSPDAASAGRRSLKNSALTWLSYAEPTPERAATAFAGANNMTEIAHA